MFRAIRKLLVVAVLAALAIFGARALYRALASPETKIRWRLEEMVEGFNEMRMQPVLDGIAKDFVDHSGGVTRDELRSTLAWMFLNELGSEGEFLWTAEFDPREMTLEVAPDERSATVECRVQVFHRRRGSQELDWDAHIAGTFTLGEDGWQWSTVTSANHSERRGR